MKVRSETRETEGSLLLIPTSKLNGLKENNHVREIEKEGKRIIKVKEEERTEKKKRAGSMGHCVSLTTPSKMIIKKRSFHPLHLLLTA